jgi:predicted N-acetyltransferase YhbS
MTERIIQLTANDFEEAMDFFNLIFSAYAPHDFESMLPHVYRPTEEQMGYNYAIKTGGRIRAIVGMVPITWEAGGVEIRVAGIGGVSTHPKWRSHGFMKALMNHCLGRMKEQGYHASWLGGQRQRYLYFGYERCGSMNVFTVNKTNVRHCFQGEANLHLDPLVADDADRIAKAKALHDARPVHCRRPLEDFHKYCVSWNCRPLVAMDVDGRMVGYLVVNKKGSAIAELVAETDDLAVRMVHAWLANRSEDSVTIDVHPLWAGLARKLGEICEDQRIVMSGNWRIFDWVTVADALMKMRRAIGPMAEGRVVVEIDGYGTIELSVDGEEAACIASDAAHDLHCSPPAAMRLLFGPLRPSLVLPVPERAAPLESWCPLPLGWCRQDGV